MVGSKGCCRQHRTRRHAPTEGITNWLFMKYGYAPAFFTAQPGATTSGHTTFVDVMKPKKHIPRITALFDEAARISHILAESTGLPQPTSTASPALTQKTSPPNCARDSASCLTTPYPTSPVQ